MESISIEKIKDNYIDRVLEINALSFKDSWCKNSFIKELENNFVHYIVAIKDNSIILGYAGIWIILDEAHIISIAIDPNYRGLGISSKLMNELIYICKNKGVNAITLEVRKSNIIAQNLYKKFKFKEEGIRKKYYPDKEDAIIMWNRCI